MGGREMWETRRRNMQLSRMNLLALMLLAMLLSSCGGSSAPAGPGGNQTSLSGNFQIDGSVRGTSALSGLNGDVSLINAQSGNLLATTPTSSSGSFTFNNVPSGENLLKLEFVSDYQLGQDGSNTVELLVPVTVVGGINNSVDGSITISDTNDDGTPDGLQVDTKINDDSDLRLIEPGDGFVRIDEDGDGDCMDEDKLRDLDGDGLPEDAHGRDHSLRGGVLKGPIESISETELVVNGVLFNITDATRFKDHGDRNPDMSLFAEGTNVLIRGMFNGDEWTAFEVKTTGVRDKGEGDDHMGGGDDDDDSEGDDDSGDDDDVDDDSGDDDGSGGGDNSV